MAGKAVGWAFDQNVNNPTYKFVLVALADIADDCGVAWPKYDYLSKKTGLAKRTIASAIKSLSEANLLIKIHRTNDNGGNMANVYRLPFYKGSFEGHHLQEWLENEDDTPHAADAPPQCSTDTTPVQQMHDPHAADASLYIEDTPLTPHKNIYKKNACAREHFLRQVNQAFKVGAFEKEFGHLTESEIYSASEECFEMWRDRLNGRDAAIILRVWLRMGVQKKVIRKASKDEKAAKPIKREHSHEKQAWHERIEQAIEPSKFEMWIRPMIYDGKESLIAPSRYHADYVETHFQSEISRVLRGVKITHQQQTRRKEYA